MALEVGNLPVDSLWGCGFLSLPITPPALSSFQFSCFAPCDTMLESSIFRMTPIFTHYSWAPMPMLPQRITHHSACPGTAVLNVFLITSKQEEVRTLLFFSDKFWCQKLTLNSSSVSNTLPLSKDLHYLLPLPPQTCASFSSFPPCTLCLSHPSFPLASYFLTFLRS